jgi:hypothetical protein
MKVKELIKKLQECDPESLVAVGWIYQPLLSDDLQRTFRMLECLYEGNAWAWERNQIGDAPALIIHNPTPHP